MPVPCNFTGPNGNTVVPGKINSLTRSVISSMKRLYTILFFTDIIIFCSLVYLFLQNIDKRADLWVLSLILAGSVLSIIMLIYLLIKYINQPSQNGDK